MLVLVGADVLFVVEEVEGAAGVVELRFSESTAVFILFVLFVLFDDFVISADLVFSCPFVVVVVVVEPPLEIWVCRVVVVVEALTAAEAVATFAKVAAALAF